MEIFARLARGGLTLPCVELVFDTLRRRCADEQRGNVDGAIAGGKFEAREARADVIGSFGKAAGITKNELSLGR